MAENQPNGQAANQPQLSVQKIYIKDASFEVPNAPFVFQDPGQPQVQLNLAQQATALTQAQDVFELELTVTVTCKIGDKTAYLAEVKQAGIFGVAGFDEAARDAVLGSYCPNALFPYARQAISDLVQSGGFPPFLLQPINFDALYAEASRRRAAGETGDTPALNA